MYNASFIILSQQQLHLQQSLQFYETSTPREQSSTAQAAPSYPDPYPNDSLLQYEKKSQIIQMLAPTGPIVKTFDCNESGQRISASQFRQSSPTSLEGFGTLSLPTKWYDKIRNN